MLSRFFDEACRFRVKAIDSMYLLSWQPRSFSLEHTGLTTYFMMPLSETKGYTVVNVRWGWEIGMRCLAGENKNVFLTLRHFSLVLISEEHTQ